MDNVSLQRVHNTFHSNGERENGDDLDSRQAILLSGIILSLQSKFEGKVLNLGCRMGYANDTFIDNLPDAEEIVGIDIVPEFIEYAKENHRGTFLLGDATNLEFPDDYFDWVFCSQTLEHVPAMNKAIKEIQRVARVGAYLSVPLEPDDETSRKHSPSHYHFEPNAVNWLIPWKDWRGYLLLGANYKPQDNSFDFCFFNPIEATVENPSSL